MRLATLATDPDFLERYDAVMRWFAAETSFEHTSFARVLLERHLGREPPHDRVVSLEKFRIRGERRQAHRIEIVQEIDGIVAVEVPQVGVDREEQSASFAVPAPREVVRNVGQAANALGDGGRNVWWHWWANVIGVGAWRYRLTRGRSCDKIGNRNVTYPICPAELQHPTYFSQLPIPRGGRSSIGCAGVTRM